MAEDYYQEYDNPIDLWDTSNPYSNPKFIYPSGVDRTPESSNRVRRGFMRALGAGGSATVPTDPGSVGGNGPTPLLRDALAQNARLNFQFNPGEIQRQVMGRTDVQHPLNQNPLDLMQGIGASTNFNLNLTFNRQAEVAAAQNKIVSVETLRSPDTNLALYAGQIGVLADIFVLDSIIGQGVNQAGIRRLVALSRYQSQHDTSTGGGGGGSSWDAPAGTAPALNPAPGARVGIGLQPVPDEQTGAPVGSAPLVGEDPNLEQKIREMFEANGAYLVPMPVRIIFSDLFMVDGFVRGTNLLFSMFSKNMVPVIATVNLGIEAMYIGFHRQETVLTRNWMKPPEIKAAPAGGTTSAAPGAASGGTTGTAPAPAPGSGGGAVTAPPAAGAPPSAPAAHTAALDRMRRTGFFNRARFSTNHRWQAFVKGGGNPPQLHQIMNFAFQTISFEAANQIARDGLEVQSVVSASGFQYRTATGVWASAGTAVFEPSVARTIKAGGQLLSGMPEYTTAGGTYHVLKLIPNSRVPLTNGLMAAGTKYRLNISVGYRIRSGSQPWINSAKTTWVIDKLGYDMWNPAVRTINPGSY